MARNNVDFNTFYHASWKQNRRSIEENGLKANQPWDSSPKGVYVGSGPSTGLGYGDDIYEIKVAKNEPVLEDDMEYGAKIIPRDIKTSDFKRVGHVFHDRLGRSEVHLHPEEHCDGASIYD
jgi:hypothetical protein